ncbi:MAG: hypothetical protein QXU98_01885 [Candidatus Parvarchaeota archaeon]
MKERTRNGKALNSKTKVVKMLVESHKFERINIIIKINKPLRFFSLV